MPEQKPLAESRRFKQLTTMGERKRKEQALLNGRCPCGSTKTARLCCFTGNGRTNRLRLWGCARCRSRAGRKMLVERLVRASADSVDA